MAKKTHVTGRACRLPGAASVQQLASVLFSGRDTVTEIPADRWTREFFLHPVPGTKGKSYTFAAGIVEDLWSFDAAPFGISPREAGQMDPQQRLLLQVVWEALEDAGLPPDRLAGQHIGVYAGCSAMAHAARLAQDAAITDAHLMTGNTLALISNRISHVLDLRGPSMTVDTACSSSIVALRLAEEALLRGEIDVAVVAAVNALLDPIHYIGFSAARMLSPKGRCQPFSATADGYVRAEGAVAFVLERRSDRELGPRRSHGVLRAVGVNTDGRTLNVALPSLEGQAALLRKVYERAEIDPAALAFVEAHGTGTLAGDPVEAGALGRVLGQARTAPLPIGSVKSNIGHLEPASGVAGMLKALIALEHRVLPPSLHAQTLNPGIDFEGLNLTVAQAALPLGEGPLLAGVSSFGFGGANAHAILERAEARPVAAAGAAADGAAPVLLLTAAGEAALGRMMADWQPLVAAEDASGLLELCGQAAAYRGRMPQRAAVICDDPAAAATALAHGAAGKADARLVTGRSELVDADVAFVFSGNGSQYAGMGLAAMAHDAAYARAMRQIDRAFRKVAGWSIIEKLTAADLDQQLGDAVVAQPLLFADQLAQFRSLVARGLRPAAVMGHSGGEVAAACAAGALSLEQALRVTHLRSVASQRLRGTGGMIAVQASAEDVREAMAAFGGGVELAAENSPRSVSVVGKGEALDAFLRHVRRVLRWPAVKLAIDYPYHSRAFAPVAEALRQQLRDLRPSAARIAFISSVTGREMTGEDLNADHWSANVRQPVAFAPAMEALRERGISAYLEIGPSPVLQAYMTGCLEGAGCVVLPGLDRAEDGTATGGVNPVAKVVARAAVAGIGLQGSGALPRATGHRGDLPTYPWEPEEVRIDRTPGILNRYGDGLRQHPLLGREEGVEARVWYSNIDSVMVPALADHQPGGRVILPGTWLTELMLAASVEVTGADGVALQDVDFLAPIVLSRQSLTEVQVRALPEQGRVTIGVRTRGESGGYRVQAQGRMERGPAMEIAVEAPDPAPQPGDRPGARLYVTARRLGLHYGPSFALVERERRIAPGVVEVFLRDHPPLDGTETRLLWDVVGADAAFHALIPALEETEFERAGLGFVPVRIGRLVLHRAAAQVASARVTLRRKGVRTVLADFLLFDAEGRVIAQIEAVRFQAARLQREVALPIHGFRQIALPMAQRGSGAEMLDGLRAALEAMSFPADDGYFLIEAAAQALAAEGMRVLARDGLVTAPLPSLWAEGMLGIALRAGMVEPATRGWRLTAAGKAASAAPLIALIGTEHPELAPEAAILAHLAKHVPSLATVLDAELPRPEELFGRAALDGLRKGSVFRQRRRAALVEAVQAAVAAQPAGALLRIAEVVEDTARLLPRLMAGIAPGRAVFAEIVSPGAEDGPISHPDRLIRVEATVQALRAAGGCDLILSDGALSATGLPLLRLAEGLAPEGRIAAIEAEPSDFADLVLGLEEGWFSGGVTAEGPLSALQTGADWIAAAQIAGLAGESVALPDACGAAQLVSVARAASAAEQVAGGDAALAGAVAQTMKGRVDAVLDAAGWRIAAFPQGGAGDDPVAALAARVLLLRDVVTKAAGAEGVRLLFVVPGGSGLAEAEADPGQAAVWALIRSAANEHPTVPMLRCDPVPGLAPDAAAARLVALIAAGTAETEVVIRPEGAAALRVMQGVVDTGHRMADAEGARAVLRAAAAGGLDDLRWQREPRREPGPGEVEIAVAATGLNYRDVMWSMGVLPEEALERGFAGPTIGLECAGRVLRCGPGVTGLAPGDAVLTFGPSSFASHVTVKADLAARLPDRIAPEAAATLPVAFFTAWYAMVTLAGLQAGDWVLIHGAAGGVGLAALQIAQHRGLRVIATAGSEVKRSVLAAEGVEHVLDSRTLDFAAAVREITGGRGVDAVLNGLAGMAMERSLGCLAPFGRFLELGKQDFYANTAVGLRPLKENIVYHGIDVDQVMAARPDLAVRVFSEVMAAFAAGVLRPLPYRAFAADESVAAFRLMQKSGHLGKIVVVPPDPARLQETEGALGRFAPSQTGWHLIVGGLGGLGLDMAEWLVACGAKRLALMSRRGIAEGAAVEAIARWRRQGVEVRPIACDVADGETLARALAELVPLAGVIHSAMVLEDMPLAAITPEVLARVLPAKVAGAAHLDRLTRGAELQYFVLFSSMATLIGNHGQSAYVAANGYLEGIARARRAAGLPGLAVGWGAISDVGYLTRDRETAALVRRMSGGTEFTGVQATRALERLLSMGDAVDPVVHVSPMGWNAVSVTLRTLGEPAFGLLRALGRRTEAEAGEDDLRSVLTGMTEARAAERLEGWLVARVAHILQVPEKAVVATKPVADLGVDSLMGVELGLTVQQTLGDDIPVTLISDALSLREIALRIVRHLHGADAAVEERAEEIRMAEQHLGSVAALRETRAEAAE